MSDMTPITDFHDLRKIVNAGTTVIQEAKTNPNIWGDDKREVRTIVGAVTAVEIVDRGADSHTAKIWMKDVPEPIFISSPQGNEPASAYSYRVLSDGFF